MKEKYISVHHIGARAGSRAFPIMSKFEKDIINVLYDADSDSIAQISEKNQNNKSELHVFSYCLGEDQRYSTFNVNYDPYTSSLYEKNSDYDSYYFDYGNKGDYLVSETARTVEKREIEMTSMDHLYQDKIVSVPPPDFLSLDTQGSEYEILLGAKNILGSNCLALQLETMFHPLYKNQKLFGDINCLLSEQGFLLVNFLDLGELSPYRAPLGQRSKGFLVSTDAFFIKDIDHLNIKDEYQRYIMLNKLAFISIIYHQFEYGLKCLNFAKKIMIDEKIKNELESVVYYRFLKELEKQLECMPETYPKTFSQRFTLEQSKRRFQSKSSYQDKNKAEQKDFFQLLKNLIKNIPILHNILISLRKKSSNSRKLFKYCFYLAFDISPLEKVLKSYGLIEQAKCIKKKRYEGSL